MPSVDSEGFVIVQDGDTVFPALENYQQRCCDCGLVHTLRHRVYKVARNLKGEEFMYEVPPEEYRIGITVKRGVHETV